MWRATAADLRKTLRNQEVLARDQVRLTGVVFSHDREQRKCETARRVRPNAVRRAATAWENRDKSTSHFEAGFLRASRAKKTVPSTRNAIEPGAVDPAGAIGGTRPPGALSMGAACRQIVSSACGELECHRLREADPPKDCALRELNDIAFGEVDSP